jgi:hypothetical protein
VVLNGAGRTGEMSTRDREGSAGSDVSATEELGPKPASLALTSKPFKLFIHETAKAIIMISSVDCAFASRRPRHVYLGNDKALPGHPHPLHLRIYFAKHFHN